MGTNNMERINSDEMRSSGSFTLPGHEQHQNDVSEVQMGEVVGGAEAWKRAKERAHLCMTVLNYNLFYNC